MKPTYFHIYKGDEIRAVEELSDFMWEQGWRVLNSTYHDNSITLEQVEESNDYFRQLQYGY